MLSSCEHKTVKWNSHQTPCSKITQPFSLLASVWMVNKDAISGPYLECWADGTCGKCRWFAVRSVLRWWWWLSPGNTGGEVDFNFILFNQTCQFHVTNYYGGGGGAKKSKKLLPVTFSIWKWDKSAIQTLREHNYSKDLLLKMCHLLEHCCLAFIAVKNRCHSSRGRWNM